MLFPLVRRLPRWLGWANLVQARMLVDLSTTHLHIQHPAVVLRGGRATVLKTHDRIAWADIRAIRHQSNLSARSKSPAMVDDPVMAGLPIFSSEDIVLTLNDGSEVAFDLKEYVTLPWLLERLQQRLTTLATGSPSEVPDGIRQLLDKPG
jgi:hypothetical protein